ncbi:MAG TPA: pyridoxal 5'-phosphate synthase glutaminase subunit PdxT [Dehalococcoidia bacterium]|nr:pyridoxal 5'-phosphate synthase glutaminase subunit PdxT [Dehalococcoidia bacterium]
MAHIGVLALQGDFAEHIRLLETMGVEATEVRLADDLRKIQALIIPGGESTTISRLMADFALVEPLRKLVGEGLPLLGTCAGLILMARKATDLALETLRVMDIEVKRNAFGRQVDSFETELAIPALGDAPFPAVFIRAPVIERLGPGVEALARLPEGWPVAIRQKNLLACAFHPELSRDLRLHAYFLNMLSQ